MRITVEESHLRTNLHVSILSEHCFKQNTDEATKAQNTATKHQWDDQGARSQDLGSTAWGAKGCFGAKNLKEIETEFEILRSTETELTLCGDGSSFVRGQKLWQKIEQKKLILNLM